MHTVRGHWRRGRLLLLAAIHRRDLPIWNVWLLRLPHRVLSRVLNGILDGVLGRVLEGMLRWVLGEMLLRGPPEVTFGRGIASSTTGGVPFGFVTVVGRVPTLPVRSLVLLVDAKLFSTDVAALRILVPGVVAAVVGRSHLPRRWRGCAIGWMLRVALVWRQWPVRGWKGSSR